MPGWSLNHTSDPSARIAFAIKQLIGTFLSEHFVSDRLSTRGYLLEHCSCQVDSTHTITAQLVVVLAYCNLY